MEHKYIAVGLGILFVIGNKVLKDLCIAWEKGAMGTDIELNQWVYRGFFIISGVLLILISLGILL